MRYMRGYLSRLFILDENEHIGYCSGCDEDDVEGEIDVPNVRVVVENF